MSIEHKDGKVEGTTTLRKIFKKIRKFFKNIINHIIYFFNPKSDKLSDKFKKKMKKKKKKEEKLVDLTFFERLAIRLSGCDNLKAQPA